MTRSLNLGMRLMSLALCVVCLLCFVQPVGATEEITEQAPETLTTVVHNRPYEGATVIGQMENGTVVSVLDKTGAFYRIDCYDTDGYIAASQISRKNNGEYYVNCREDSPETRTFTYADHSEALQLRFGLVALAQQQLGKPYIYGSTGTRGFDCSGLMCYIFGAYGYELNRRASEQLQDGIVVSREGMQVGDMIFLRESWDSCAASHVGIYVGNNQILHASSSRGVVIDSLDMRYFANNFLCVRRVIHTPSAPLEVEAPVVMPRSMLPSRRAS